MIFFKNKLLLGIFTLSGTMIGAGMLGLPYVFSKSGILAGLIWLILLGILMLFVHLYLGEVVLRTSGEHQLAGYAEKYLGKIGKKLMFFAMFFGIYSALLAYLIGEGQSLSYFFTGSIDYAVIFGCIFWFVLTLFLKEGIKQLKKIGAFAVPIVLLLIVFLFIYLFPRIQLSNLSYFDTNFLFLPLGVTLFALLGFSSIPEVREVMKGNEKKFKYAMIFGTLIPIFAYAVFTFVFLGVFGENIQEVATISVGKFGSFLGIFTMITSYFVLSFALKEAYVHDIKLDKKKSFLLVSVIPLVIYLAVSLFDLAGFVIVLGIGGVVSGGLTGILILLMNYKSKKYSERYPEYWIPINWPIIIVISLILIFGILIELAKII